MHTQTKTIGLIATGVLLLILLVLWNGMGAEKRRAAQYVQDILSDTVAALPRMRPPYVDYFITTNTHRWFNPRVMINASSIIDSAFYFNAYYYPYSHPQDSIEIPDYKSVYFTFYFGNNDSIALLINVYRGMFYYSGCTGEQVALLTNPVVENGKRVYYHRDGNNSFNVTCNGWPRPWSIDVCEFECGGQHNGYHGFNCYYDGRLHRVSQFPRISQDSLAYDRIARANLARRPWQF